MVNSDPIDGHPTKRVKTNSSTVSICSSLHRCDLNFLFDGGEQEKH
jgi:hypothetical protein